MTSRQGFPQLGAPLADPSGRITQPWYQLLLALWNRTGQASGTLSAVLDNIGNARGDLLYRGATEWRALAPGASGRFLQTHGPDADPQWAPGNAGTVTHIDTGAGLSGGPIAVSGTIALASIAAGSVLANVRGAPDVPAAVSPSALLDLIGLAPGALLYRSATDWAVLPPGSAGQVLTVGSAASNPAWSWARTVALSVTAAGSDQGSATLLAADVNQVATVGAGQGVACPVLAAGRSIMLFNDGANALAVYPAAGAQIDALGANHAYLLAVGRSQIFWALTPTQLRSTQLG